MNKNTLYITFDGLSDPLGQSQILPYLTGIAKNGYQITILSCEKDSALASEKQNIEQLIKDLPIEWNFIMYDEDGGFLSRMRNVKKLKDLAVRCVREKKIRLTHCRSYLASLIGLSLKRKFKIPFIFDMRGYWADERYDGNIWNKNNFMHQIIYTYFKKKELAFLAESDAIVSLTNAAQNDLEKRFSKELIHSKTSVIPCCTNTSFFDRTNITNKRNVTGLKPDDLLLIYTGSVGTWYYTKEMIDCVLHWRNKLPQLKLLILTKDKPACEAILNQYQSSERECIFVERASYKEVPSYLALAKASIFFIKPAYSKIASSPTKMAECWSMNLPIITNAGIGDNDLYFNSHHGGVLVNSFNSKGYEEALDKFMEEMKLNHNYRKIALDHFDTQMAIKKYVGIYDKITM